MEGTGWGGVETATMATRVCVTGAAGEVGRALCRWLASQPEPVTVIGLDRRWTTPPDGGAHMVSVDLGEADPERIVGEAACDSLVHLAAIAGRAAEADPAATDRLNVAVSGRLLSACAARRIRFVTASSVAAIGRATGGEAAGEASPLEPLSAYGRSKVALERLVRAAHAAGHEAVAIRLPTLLLRSQPRSGRPTSGFLSDVGRALIETGNATTPMPPGFELAVAGVDEAAHALGRLCLDPLPPGLPPVVNLPAFPLSAQRLAAAIAERRPHISLAVTSRPDPEVAALCGEWPRALRSAHGEWLGIRPDLSVAERIARILDRAGLPRVEAAGAA